MKLGRELLSYAVIIAVVVLIRAFIITPVRVDGPSMNPTYIDGEIVLLNKTKSKFDYLDVVVFKYGNDRLIKRVIGVPGDTVEIKDNKIIINGNEYEDYDTNVITKDFSLSEIGYDKIPAGKYFVLGDNRGNSTDSRIIGLIDQTDIAGNIVYRIFPFSRFGTVK